MGKIIPTLVLLGASIANAGLENNGPGPTFCATEWDIRTVTIYEHLVDCAPPTSTLFDPTVICPCSECPTYTVTCEDQPIVFSQDASPSVFTKHCPTNDVYQCNSAPYTVTNAPSDIIYTSLCPIQYLCPYNEWLAEPSSALVKHVTILHVVGGEPLQTQYQNERYGIQSVVKTKSFTSPTIFIDNNISIDVSVAPTVVTYTVTTTTTTTSTVTVAPISATTTNATTTGIITTTTTTPPTTTTTAIDYSNAINNLHQPFVLVVNGFNVSASAIGPLTEFALFDGIALDSNGNYLCIDASSETFASVPGGTLQLCSTSNSTSDPTKRFFNLNKLRKLTPTMLRTNPPARFRGLRLLLTHFLVGVNETITLDLQTLQADVTWSPGAIIQFAAGESYPVPEPETDGTTSYLVFPESNYVLPSNAAAIVSAASSLLV
jgi:hypothetical protein